MNTVKFSNDTFKSIVNSLKDLSEKIEIYFMKNSFEIQMLDDAKTCMININFDSSCPLFDKFEVVNENTVCVNINILNDVLKLLNTKTGTIEINHNIAKDYINFVLNKNINFNIKLLALKEDSKRLKTSFPYQNIISVNSNEFEKIIKSIGAFGDTCYLLPILDSKCLEISVSDDMGNGTIQLECNILSENLNITTKLKCSLKYLLHITKLHKICDTLEIGMDNVAPLCFKYFIMDTKNYVEYYLAPYESEQV